MIDDPEIVRHKWRRQTKFPTITNTDQLTIGFLCNLDVLVRRRANTEIDDLQKHCKYIKAKAENRWKSRQVSACPRALNTQPTPTWQTRPCRYLQFALLTTVRVQQFENRLQSSFDVRSKLMTNFWLTSNKKSVKQWEKTNRNRKHLSRSKTHNNPQFGLASISGVLGQSLLFVDDTSKSGSEAIATIEHRLKAQK